MTLKKNVLALLGLAVIVLGASFIIFSSFNFTPDNVSSIPETSESELEPELLYGLTIDGYDIETNTIGRNEFLSDILQRYQVDLPTISILAGKSKSVFDVRKIGAGHDYTIFMDESGKADYFVYQPNAVDYVVYDLRDSINVYMDKKEVDTRIETVAGVIGSSLYEALQANGANPDLAVQLAEIYGWAVNFYRINKGDWFKLVYERKYVEGNPIGPGRIQSAIFGHSGKEYQAYYFEWEDGKPGAYYDENGKSLRRTFLKAPLKFSRISSRYTMRRFHPVQRVWKAHLGTDFAAPHGTPIVATANGVVTASSYAGGNGNYVKIKHDNVYETQYLHMSKRAVKKGQRVSQGQVIGYVGSTGLATGPHVCYRFWKHGKQVDALSQIFPPSEPINDKHRVAFERILNTHQQSLATLDFEKKQSNLELFGSLGFDIERLFEPIASNSRILEGFSAQML
ncbi:M23 family metallopeptidase [Parapedobacter tibetensis]|uniref:M23 family metallopeptidase n=1 Tax=Parapedobacter tibetensis TaxID=2972951 RepID=UPI00214D9180|nr:peptidoglycan DD-metalloendopeptidase family protein [Parapedobacter tibetensis]